MRICLLFVICFFGFAPSVYAESATLEDYWQGQAEWQPYHKLTPSTGWSLAGMVGGTQIIAHQDKWYFLYRMSTNDSSCNGGSRTWTEIRESSDHGITWSSPAIVINNQVGTPWQCNATDGGIFYDSSQDKWLYLFQCTGSDDRWNGCLAQRAGSSPYGEFTTTGIANPVIPRGSLWSRTCAQPNSRCSSNTYDEGTYDIFGKQNNTYMISYHGFDGANGYRGIATTDDFVNFTPASKAYLSPEDSQLWRENWQGASVGFGAGNITFENGYYYSFNEATDLNLFCTLNQNWDWGIYRSSDLNNWEPYPLGNPILYSNKWVNPQGQSLPCLPAYGRIFKHGSEIYLHIIQADISSESNWIENDGIHIYKLVKKTNLLQNGTFWKCNLDNWNSITSSSIEVERFGNQTPDGTCNIKFSQGDIYQDVTNFTVGGSYEIKINAKSDDGGYLNFVAHELDSNYAIIRSHSLTVRPSSKYGQFSQTFVTSQQAKTIRVQLYHKAGTVKVDTISIDPVISNIAGDLSGDGHVDLEDYNILILGYGTTYSLADYNNIVANYGI